MDLGEKPETVLKVLYNSLTNENLQKELSLTLWTEKIPIRMPKLEEDVFPGASLTELVKKFKNDTMLIWYGLFLGKRVMFVGTPAKAVANWWEFPHFYIYMDSCLAAPLLVRPLRGFTKIIFPYVALTYLDPVLTKNYICGSTNKLFATKQGL